MAGPQLTQRDFKTRPPRQRPQGRLWLPFAGGLGLGLLMAVVVFIKEHKPAPPVSPPPQAPTAAARKERPARAVPAPLPSGAEVGSEGFEFYDRLRVNEVVLPERDKTVSRQSPTTRITEPGTYVLQVGSYREEAEALLHRDRYLKQGYPASVQRVALDADVWHRVRIGPISDLARLNTVREQLYRANVPALVVRIVD